MKPIMGPIIIEETRRSRINLLDNLFSLIILIGIKKDGKNQWKFLPLNWAVWQSSMVFEME